MLLQAAAAPLTTAALAADSSSNESLSNTESDSHHAGDRSTMRLGHRQRRAARRGAENVAALAEVALKTMQMELTLRLARTNHDRPFLRRKVARVNAAPGMGAAFLGVTELSRGGKGVRIAVTLLRLEVELPYLMERYQQKGSIQLGEHKASVQAILQKTHRLIDRVATDQERLASEILASDSESDSDEASESK